MQTAILVTVLLIGSFLVLNYIARARMKKIPMVADHDNILVLNDTNFKHQLKNKIVLVDFWASWCAPCRMMAPVLNDVASDLNGNTCVGKVDIEQYQSLAREFKVRSIPTMVLFKNGQEIDRFVGIKSKDFLLKQFQTIK
jgi:thioredoxin 1